MTKIDDALVERMTVLIRAWAHDESYYPFRGYGETIDEAKAVSALLPEPVDPDLVEARTLAWEHSDCKKSYSQSFVMDGRADNGTAVKAMLAAIKRGREMQKDGK